MKPAYKDITINERTFRIKKFSARVGAFMVIKVTSMIAPLFRGLDVNRIKDAADGKTTGDFDIIGMIEKLGNLSEQDFNYLQENCLGVCYEVLPAGVAPVLNENGTFGVTGLDEDAVTVLALTAHALLFNMKSVFQESPLGSLMGSILNMSQQN